MHSGELSAEDSTFLQDVCEPLHIGLERASALLQYTVNSRASLGFLQAAAFLRQERHFEAAEELGRILKYAGLISNPKADCPAISQNERVELYSIFEASIQSGAGAEEGCRVQLGVLREVAGLEPLE